MAAFNLRSLSFVAVIALISGCASNQPMAGSGGSSDQSGTVEASNSLQLSDMAIPPGSKFDMENSLIIGNGDRWLGRIGLKNDSPSVQLYNYIYKGMPSYGWTLVAAIQSKISTLTYQRGDRIATIQIESGSLSGSNINITVSLRQMQSAENHRSKKGN